MVKKPETSSPSKLLTSEEALALAKHPEVSNVVKNKHGW